MSVRFAEQLAGRMHRNQLDKAGKPYYEHLAEVAKRVTAAGLEAGFMYDAIQDLQQVAWLHDIVEDTRIGIDDLMLLEFSPDVVAGVEAMTKNPGEDRRSYVMKVAANRLALHVKIADIEHNLEEGRNPVTWEENERTGYRAKLCKDRRYLITVRDGKE